MLAKSFRDRRKFRLHDLRCIRRELSVCYAAWCKGEIDDNALRAGSLALSRMAAIDQGQMLDQRVAQIEARLAEHQPSRPTNGHADHAAARP